MHIWRKAHNDYPSEYYSSADKCVKAILDEYLALPLDERECIARTLPNKRQILKGATVAGWWMTKEHVA